jgi:WD40 repeat protein
MWCLQLAMLAADFLPAYIHPGNHGPQLTLFPMIGAEITVPAPSGLPNGGRVVFGPDGKTIFVLGSDDVSIIELKPAHQSIVRGTSGFTAVWHFKLSQPSGRAFVSGLLRTPGGVECGTYQVDPGAERPRKLLAGTFPDCGGGGGDVSPDGARALSYSGGNLCLINLATGAAQAIDGLKGLGRDDVTWKHQVVWSPDGKWIAVARDGGIILVDPTTSRLKKIGGGGNSIVDWSPDSTKLLVLKSQLSCMTSLYFESLALIDLQTRKESIIKGSHCKVSGGFVGWLDPDAVR